jgi:catechol 2,3-dioxygenase-like lactoylglutathione lyase family enzyme
MGISHIGITVKNLEKSVEFYQDCLGLKLQSRPSDICDDEEEAIGVGVKGASTRFCTFDIGNGQLLELVEYVTPPSDIKKPMPLNNLGQHHLSLKVDKIHEWVEYLSAKGVEFLYRPLLINEGVYDGIWWVYLRDPDGIIIELMEYTK